MYNVVEIQLIATSIWAYSLTPWPFYYVQAWKIYFTLDVLLKLVTHTTDIVVLIYKLKIYLSCDTMAAECMGTDRFFPYVSLYLISTYSWKWDWVGVENNKNMRTAKFNIAVLKTNQTLHKFLFIISISELVTIIITRKLFTLPFYQEAFTNKTAINPDQGGGGGG